MESIINSNTSYKRTYFTREKIIEMQKKSMGLGENECIYLEYPDLLTALESCMIVKQVAGIVGFQGLQGDADKKELAICVLSMSSKMEETIKKVRELVTKAYFVDEEGELIRGTTESEIESKRLEVLGHEGLVLKAINFDFSTTETHLDFIKIAKMLNCKKFEKKEYTKVDFQTPLSIQHGPLVLVVGAIVMGIGLGGGERTETHELFWRGVRRGGYREVGRIEGEQFGSEKEFEEKVGEEFESVGKIRWTENKWWERLGVLEKEVEDYLWQMAELYTNYERIRSRLEIRGGNISRNIRAKLLGSVDSQPQDSTRNTPQERKGDWAEADRANRREEKRPKTESGETNGRLQAD
ncbi:hypothetical protein BB558_002705 [Smittium angustum]|uniref:Uncharacterized protein n=1 Tax=Smittium angustum TaxID=133377 RepID=A0A2U1J822_SMIAN|nr:hypothetical protein BB558_002705 [Smittium angustum]